MQSSYRPAATQVVVVSSSLSAAHIDIIRDYYSDAGQGKSRGRKGGLPPGIAKNLQRGKPLPPGIAKQHLPHDLILRLPRAADGLEYLVVAGKMLLVEVATQIVREVLIEAVFD